MLVIGRKRDEKLIIGGNIEITILKVGRNHVKFGVEAPRHIPIQTRNPPSGSARAAGAGSASEAGRGQALPGSSGERVTPKAPPDGEEG
jgi:carbon storage regulator